MTLRQADGTVLPDVTVNVDTWSAITDTSGEALIEGVDADTAYVLTAWPQGLVEVQEAVQVGAGETVALDLVVPDVETTTFTPDGTATELGVGDTTVELPAGLAFSTGDGTAYTDDVEFRLAALDSFSLSDAPSMLSDDGAGGFEAPEIIGSFELSAVGTVGGEDVALQPSAGIVMSMPAILPDSSRAVDLQHFDAALGDRVTDGAINYAKGFLSASVDHFTWWRTAYTASTRPMAGLVISVTDNGGPRSNDVEVTVVCTEPAGGPGGSGTYIAAAGDTDSICDEFRISADCVVTASGGTVVTSNTKIGGSCRCANPARCTPVELDVSATATCGDGIVQAGETCDDGGTVAGDGCDDTCQTETATCPCAGFSAAEMTQAYDDAIVLLNHDEIECGLSTGLASFGGTTGSNAFSYFEIRADDEPNSGAEVSKAWYLGKDGSDLACQTLEGETIPAQEGPLTVDQYNACVAEAYIGLAHAGLDATCPAAAGVDADADCYDDQEDCNDTDNTINPGATEVCDGVDNNCDGLVDDDDPNLDPSSRTDWCVDADADGYGDPSSAVQLCDGSGTGLVADCTDADDSDFSVH